MMRGGMLFSLILMTALLISCAGGENATGGEEMEQEAELERVTAVNFGQTPDGVDVEKYILTNANGMTVSIITYGGIVTSIEVPDKNGKPVDVTLGYDTLEEYIEDNPYFGALVGRYANRIAFGSFTLDGTGYSLATNNNQHHLHGGEVGFDKVVWKAQALLVDGASGVRLSYISPDGEEGYPGELQVTVIYTLNDNNELTVDYTAATDAATIVNLTHHSYFNLNGCQSDVLNHQLTINADAYTPVDEGLIPTGEIRPVEGTPFDFRQAKAIGADIEDTEGGYDHNFVLNEGAEELSFAARAVSPATGISMEISTTEPGIQFYSGNFLDGSITGKAGIVYNKHYGFCLETQHFPDSPNQPDFPSVVLRPGETYKHLTVHTFGIED